MKVIIPTTPLVEQTAGRQRRADGQRYRLMTYVVQQPVADGLLLYNTLTCSLLLLTPDEAADITAQQELKDRWFLVPQEHDDRKLCQQIRQMAALVTPAVKTINRYTILTTTGCNARCFYCFEKGAKPVSMTAETAGKVVRYIVAHRGDEEVKIRWFGGEPLVNVKAIDRICTALREQGVAFRSTMISNGYLFVADKLQRATDLWQLEKVQITLDGMEQTYNRVKGFVYRGVNAFERVLTNIGLLTAAGIRVSIRLNFDQYNIGELTELVELLHRRFGANERLTIYPHELYGERMLEDDATIAAMRLQLKQQIAACGYGSKLGLQKDLKLNSCMADNDGSVVIAPDGHLSKCEHYIDREFFGHIDSEERDKAILRKFRERHTDIEACATCFHYPQCFRLVVCPACSSCTPGHRQDLLYETRERMKYEYERYLRKKDDDNENAQDDETEI